MSGEPKNADYANEVTVGMGVCARVEGIWGFVNVASEGTECFLPPSPQIHLIRFPKTTKASTVRKPRIFIASSAEKLRVAGAFNVNLDRDFEVTLWTNGTFQLSSVTLPALTEKSSEVDFALFVFAPDDAALVKGEQVNSVRDNVVFELGLFIGALGLDRCFIAKPRGVDLHLPSDLLGITMADYEANRSDGDVISATNRACSLIKEATDKLGLLERIGNPAKERRRANPRSLDMTQGDLSFLVACADSVTRHPGGMGLGMIEYGMKGVPDIEKQVSAIKLERLGYVQKVIANDDYNNGAEYFSYSLTEDGIEAILNHREKLLNGNQVPHSLKRGTTDTLDEDAPF